MSDQNDAAQSFNAEAARKSMIQIRVNQIVKTLPVQPQAEYPREEVINHLISKLEEKVELHLSDRDWLIGKTKSGEAADLTPLVRDELLLSKYIDADSVSKAISEGKLDVGSKADLKTVQQKVQFIQKYGEAAFAALPLHREAGMPADPRDMTLKQYQSLTNLQKAKLGLTEAEIYQIGKRK